MQTETDIKIEEKISELLALSDENNTEIADEIGVSAATLSAYRRGEARPSLKSLVSMSEVFDVSLDYLVFGEETDSNEIDTEPVIRQMSQSLQDSLQDSQLRQAQRISMVSNVGRRLSERVDEEVKNYLSDLSSQKLFSGTMRNPEVLELERNSVKTRLFLKSFQYNMLDSQTETPGKFFPAVVKNLSQGRSYQYLLPAAGGDWEPIIDSFRELLVENLPSEATVRNNCEFRVTDTPTVTGCGLYQLEMDDLQEETPILYDYIHEHDYSSDDWFGYTIGPSESAQGTMVMDTDHLYSSLQLFECLWDEAEPV